MKEQNVRSPRPPECKRPRTSRVEMLVVLLQTSVLLYLVDRYAQADVFTV